MAYSPPPILPDFYNEIVLNWTEVAETDPVTPSSIQNQLLWNNTKIRIGNHPIKKCLNIDFVGDLIGADGAFLSWSTFSSSPANRPSMTPFKYMQIIDAIPTSWKNIIRNNLNDFLENNGTLRDQHLLSLTRFIGLERLTSKLIYIHILSKIKAKPTSVCIAAEAARFILLYLLNFRLRLNSNMAHHTMPLKNLSDKAQAA